LEGAFEAQIRVKGPRGESSMFGGNHEDNELNDKRWTPVLRLLAIELHDDYGCVKALGAEEQEEGHTQYFYCFHGSNFLHVSSHSSF